MPEDSVCCSVPATGKSLLHPAHSRLLQRCVNNFTCPQPSTVVPKIENAIVMSWKLIRTSRCLRASRMVYALFPLEIKRFITYVLRA